MLQNYKNIKNLTKSQGIGIFDQVRELIANYEGGILWDFQFLVQFRTKKTSTL